MKLADMRGLDSRAFGRAGSTPVLGTMDNIIEFIKTLCNVEAKEPCSDKPILYLQTDRKDRRAGYFEPRTRYGIKTGCIWIYYYACPYTYVHEYGHYLSWKQGWSQEYKDLPPERDITEPKTQLNEQQKITILSEELKAWLLGYELLINNNITFSRKGYFKAALLGLKGHFDKLGINIK